MVKIEKLKTVTNTWAEVFVVGTASKKEEEKKRLMYYVSLPHRFLLFKVPELRAELEARGLETKGVKSLLCKRLQEALDQEKEKEDGEGAAPTGDIEMTDVAGDEEETEKKEEVI